MQTFNSPSGSFSNGDALGDSDAPNDDASKQDFNFEEVFEYSHGVYTSSAGNEDDARVTSLSRDKSQAEFFFSHYAADIKGAGHVKMTRTKSGLPRPRVARVKSGGRRAS